VSEYKTQQRITGTSVWASREQFAARGFQQLSILHSSRTNLFASAATQATIYVTLKRLRIAGEPSFTDSAHQIETPAWSIIFITGDDVSWTSFQAEAAMDAG
jgi:hypothetical protein